MNDQRREPYGSTILDWNGVLSEVGSDPELLEQLIATYSTRITLQLDALRRAIEAIDPRPIARAAQRLEKTFFDFFCDPPATKARALQQMCRGGDLTGLNASYAALLRDVAEIDSQLGATVSG